MPVTYLKDIAVQNIKRFSDSKRRVEIKEYPNETFGLSISVLDLISKAIVHFSRLLLAGAGGIYAATPEDNLPLGSQEPDWKRSRTSSRRKITAERWPGLRIGAVPQAE
jgi:hypothetical protein